MLFIYIVDNLGLQILIEAITIQYTERAFSLLGTSN